MVLSVSKEVGVAEDAFGVIGSALVKAVHVELPYERVHLGVPEVSWEDDGLELVDVFDDKLGAGGGPVCDFDKLLVLNREGGTLRI